MNFFSHRPGFRIFTDFPDLYFLRWRAWPFPHKKNTFFYSFHTFAHIRQHYFSKYWGDECMGRLPTWNFGGDRPLVPPRFPPLSWGIIIRPLFGTLTETLPSTSTWLERQSFFNEWQQVGFKSLLKYCSMHEKQGFEHGVSIQAASANRAYMLFELSEAHIFHIKTPKQFQNLLIIHILST